MLIDESTATRGPNIKRFSGGRIIPVKVKNHNLVLPTLKNSIKKNNLQDYEKLFISSIINNKKKKSKVNELLSFYHPFLNHLCKNEEISSFLSYCYDITKINPPPVKRNRIKINEAKYFSQRIKKKGKNYRVINLINKNLNNISVGTNTIREENKPDKRCLSIENNLDESKKFKYINIFKSKNIGESFRQSYFALSKKGNKKNYTLLNDDFSYKDSFLIQNNKSSSLKNGKDELNNSANKIEYKTIKIKNIRANNKYIDKKVFRDTFRIDSKYN